VDRRGALGFVFVLLAAGGALAEGAVRSNLPIRAAHWLAPGSDVAQALGTTPTECLSPVAGAEHQYLIELGRSAFRTPLLLGGQAARAGVSCESCHRGGRSNAGFLFAGVSGPPGTADVTSSLFSSHRGDGVDNPKPIPDLSGPSERLKISRDPSRPDLERFIHGLVVEEFDGAEPPPSVLQGLAAYVRALSPEACPVAATHPVAVTDVVAEARRAVLAADAALERGDKDSAVLMLSAARSQLALANERYDSPELGPDRALLRSADLDLASAQNAVRGGDVRVRDRLAVWLSQTPDWAKRLQADASKSLFNPARLAP
jgi:hypothetical protein